MVDGFVYVSDDDPGPMAGAVVGTRVAKPTPDPPWIVVDHALELARVVVVEVGGDADQGGERNERREDGDRLQPFLVVPRHEHHHEGAGQRCEHRDDQRPVVDPSFHEVVRLS